MSEAYFIMTYLMLIFIKMSCLPQIRGYMSLVRLGVGLVEFCPCLRRHAPIPDIRRSVVIECVKDCDK